MSEEIKDVPIQKVIQNTYKSHTNAIRIRDISHEVTSTSYIGTTLVITSRKKMTRIFLRSHTVQTINYCHNWRVMLLKNIVVTA